MAFIEYSTLPAIFRSILIHSFLYNLRRRDRQGDELVQEFPSMPGDWCGDGRVVEHLHLVFRYRQGRTKPDGDIEVYLCLLVAPHYNPVGLWLVVPAGH